MRFPLYSRRRSSLARALRVAAYVSLAIAALGAFSWSVAFSSVRVPGGSSHATATGAVILSGQRAADQWEPRALGVVGSAVAPRRTGAFASAVQSCRLRQRHLQSKIGRRDSKLYDTLGIDKDATMSEIKKAYYRQARTCHPDQHPGDEAMYNRFQEVAEAYQTLADPVRRQQYDLSGLAGLAFLKTNATRLFGPPPWRVLIGKTDHWMWEEGMMNHMLGLMGSSIPNGIAGVTMKTLEASYHEAMATRVAVLLDRVSEAQAKDTVEQLEEFGIAVKCEPIEGEQNNEKETPLQYFRRMQRELGEACTSLLSSAQSVDIEANGDEGSDFEKWIEIVRTLRSELRAAAAQLEEFKLEQTS